MLCSKSANIFGHYIRPLSRSITTNATNLIPTSMGFRVLADVTPKNECRLPPDPILLLERNDGQAEKDHYVVLGYSGQDERMAKRIMENGAPFQRIFVHHDREYCRRFTGYSTGRIFTLGAKLQIFTEVINHLGIANYSSNELLYDSEKLSEVLKHPAFYKYEEGCGPSDLCFYAPLRELMSKELSILDAKIPNKQENNSLDEALAVHHAASVALEECYRGPSLDSSPYNLVDYL